MSTPTAILLASSRPGKPTYMPKKKRWYVAPTFSHQAPTTFKRHYPEDESNLSENELRFWAGGRSLMSPIATCRCCGKFINSNVSNKPLKQLIKEHQSEFKCTKVLVEAYKLLHEKKACAMCNQSTEAKRYGVHLCKEICMSEWRFSSSSGFFLRQAIEESRKIWFIKSVN